MAQDAGKKCKFLPKVHHCSLQMTLDCLLTKNRWNNTADDHINIGKNVCCIEILIRLNNIEDATQSRLLPAHAPSTIQPLFYQAHFIY
jgi:hypothetical protein